MFNFSLSNIAWTAENDLQTYNLMQKHGFQGLEIAPTRIFPDRPYNMLLEAKKWSEELHTKYGFSISSMQSIWYGRQENIFGSDAERQTLVDYTKQAIDFASTIGCKNLVFGCPRNRNVPEMADADIAISFLKELGDYAYSKGTAIGMEANPSIYNTNYINDTMSAIELIERVDSNGFKLNLDIGTMIYNNEDPELLIGKVDLINHVHISEPWLKPIEKRKIHMDIAEILKSELFDGFISIEMSKVENINILKNSIEYVSVVFQ